MEKISRIIVIVMLVVMSQGAMARRVSQEQAGVYARNWWLQKDGSRKALLQPVATEFGNIYLFVDTAGRGFVMLAADDRSLPVLGYSLRNGFEVDSMPAAVHDWVQAYNDEIQYLIDNNIEKTAEINAKWEDLNNERSQLPQVWGSKGPLLTTKWNQQKKSTTGNDKYNNLCPSIGGTKCLTGCVATAMAQIMKYHNFPTNGVGSNTYTPNGFTYSLTADFANTTYDWANMPVECYSYSTSTEDQAVALLMYHVGVAVNMNYGTGESEAKTVAANYNEPAAVNAYKKYFKYKWTAHCVYKEDYTNEDWKLLLKAEIDANRPIQYSGAQSGGGGHSFVCDGYDNSEQFHINWGYSGGRDGYFAIGSLNYNTNTTYNESNRAIIGIEPDKTGSGSITVTATSNNTAWGTVTGGGTYTKYTQTVTLTPVAKPGCKFIGWSNGSKEVPYSFLANGNGATLVANFAQIGGDTLYYCNNGFTRYYGSPTEAQYAAIKIPKERLVDGSVLKQVMFFATYMGSNLYEISLYRGSLTSTPCTTFTYRSYSTYKWVTANLTNTHTIDATQDLYIVVKSPYYFAASMPAANADASWGRLESGSWTQMQPNGANLTWMIKGVIEPDVIVHKIAINKNAVDLTTVSKNVNLRSAKLGTSNKGATVSYQIVSQNPANIVTLSSGYLLTAKGVGTVRIKAFATDSELSYAESEVDLQIGRGTLTWNNYDNHFWSESSYWGPNGDVVPDSINYDVDIKGALIIDVDANCHNLNTSYASVITVNRDAKLEISGTVTTQSVYNIYIKADEYGSGTVIFGSGTPKGTVEMYLKGTIGSDGKDPQWQLRGSILDNFDFEPFNYGKWDYVHVYEWDELLNASGCWTNKMVGSQVSLDSWKGYGFANYSTNPIIVTYSGTLINSDKTWTLTKTGSGNANVGNNMLTNSYAAPIEISKLQFVNAQSSVIFYNTGSLVEWQQYGGSLSNTGTSPGQFLVCPVVTSPAAGMPTAIPSGQSFYVVANQDGATVSVNYSDVKRATSGPMLMPEEEFNVLGVRIKGENGGDRVVLVESERCGDEYDDGYDGMKYFGSAEMPQLFVVNGFGNTSINASQTMIGQRIGVEYGSGKRLKMAFETEKLTGYGQLMLHDLKTGQYVDILGNAEYEFVTMDDDWARFEIVRSKHEAEGEMTVSGNELYTGENEGRLMISDMSGRVLWERDVQRNETVQLPELLHGVYVIKSETSTIKIVR